MSELAGVLEELEPTEPMRNRLEELLSYYKSLDVKVSDVFVSETLDDDGLRRFASLWVFNDVGTMEALVAESEENQLDGARIHKQLVRWAVRSHHYDFVTAVPESRLSVQLWYTDELWGDLEASGSNCDRLRAILKKYVIPETGSTQQPE